MLCMCVCLFCCYLVPDNLQQPGAPAELVLLLPGAEAGADGSPVATVEAGSELPELSFGAMDAGGNRTAPFQNETWQVYKKLGVVVMLCACVCFFFLLFSCVSIMLFLTVVVSF